MRLQEDLEIFVRAPIRLVWDTLNDFESWPRWSTYIKGVRKEPTGYRFVARGMPPVDLVWVAQGVKREEPHYLEFASVPGAQHDLNVSGWVKLEETPKGTQLDLHFEGMVDFSSPLLERVADVYATLFGEPHKLLKVTLEEFKREVERKAQLAAA
jgi:uncharacterized membrane protein